MIAFIDENRDGAFDGELAVFEDADAVARTHREADVRQHAAVAVPEREGVRGRCSTIIWSKCASGRAPG